MVGRVTSYQYILATVTPPNPRSKPKTQNSDRFEHVFGLITGHPAVCPRENLSRNLKNP